MINKMLSIIRKRSLKLIKVLSSSIAFYPTIISFGLFLLAIYLVNTEYADLTAWLKENMPFLVVTTAEAARTILSTIIGGIISLTVFSFSMVMITLNQASSNFSPRILPGLVSEKNNQVVLGFYLGTAIFCLVVLLSLKPNNDIYSLSVLSVLISMMLFIFCLGLFISFINHISTSIQVDNIMNKIYRESLKNLQQLTEAEDKQQDSRVQNETAIRAEKSNFYQGVLKSELLKVCKDHKVNIHITADTGSFVHQGSIICHYDIEKNLEIEEKILAALHIDDDHRAIDTYSDGFSQLTEIGLKAMSPGINDPATALITLNYLSSLFLERLKISDYDVSLTEDGMNMFMEDRVPFAGLLKECISQYRLYCKENMVLMIKLKELLQSLLRADHRNPAYATHISRQLDALNTDALNYLTNEKDLSTYNIQ